MPEWTESRVTFYERVKVRKEDAINEIERSDKAERYGGIVSWRFRVENLGIVGKMVEIW